jgi:hypothetical protein
VSLANTNRLGTRFDTDVPTCEESASSMNNIDMPMSYEYPMGSIRHAIFPDKYLATKLLTLLKIKSTVAHLRTEQECFSGWTKETG